jgi:hypothetical protein|tara:strand:+ start:330 stop:521 length:192 start_codon:yes stop_codon:yes gene_type:complete
MNIELPACILLDDPEKQVLKDAMLCYIKELEIKAKKDKVLSVEAYQQVMSQLSEIIKKTGLSQ